MESVDLVLPGVLDPEVVPLTETLGAIVIFQIELVLKRSHFHGFPEISTFEARFED